MAKNKRKNGPEQLKKAIGAERGARQRAATDVGMYPSQLSHIINGRRRPSLQQALDIEERFGVPPRSWVVRK